MKALTIQQPWAWLIIRPDITDPQERAAAIARGEVKNFENRTWYPRGNQPFRFLVHAGKTIDAEAWQWVRRRFPGITMPAQSELQTGGIIGSVLYTGSLNYAMPNPNPWWTGPCGWHLEDPTPLPFTPLRGQLGLFDVPAEVIREIQKSASEVTP